MPIRVLIRDQPHRAIALATETHVLIFRHSTSTIVSKHGTAASVSEGTVPRCIVEFQPWERANMSEFRTLSNLSSVYGTLGLVTINGDVFICLVNGQSKVAVVRPGENVMRIQSVEFHCLSRADYDHLLNDQVNPFPTDGLDADGFDHAGHKESLLEHPCMALKKLLSGGSFYYSADFDLTKRVQDRPTDASSMAMDSLDDGFLWNTYMIQPLVDFRSRLSPGERSALDATQILTSAIRGFALTVTVPASSSPVRHTTSGMPSTLTLISRLSCRRAGTRFNARGIDDDGNVANFVESETIFCTDEVCFSYVQCRGSVPIFWEQASGLPGQQKVTITRSVEASRPAFEKHVMGLYEVYGDVFVVNLLSKDKPNETQLTHQYEEHIAQSASHDHVKIINYDFHAETKGPNGYEAASGIRRWIMEAAIGFEYYLSSGVKQAGVFRTNCLDCLDRTNLVQTIISQMALEIFIKQHDDLPTSDFWARHGMLWADCGDALSKIYAGTGALKSSFTRSGKMTFAGAIADLRKSAQRLYINNFEDKGRQNTIDMLLGRLIGQMPVHLYDPVNDWVVAELAKRAPEYMSPRTIHLWIGTFNLNGKLHGVNSDLSPWLPDSSPEIVAVAFQEIVELSAQQILQTDPYRRAQWDDAVRKSLKGEYVLLRGGQLVGASLSIFVKSDALPFIKNVEGAVKKTGMSGMAGNKGAVAIRMDYADTSICFVTAHLAAGFANYEERNQDYRTINSGLRFQRNRTIEAHDAIIWFGDFNYRIGMSNDRVRQLIDAGELDTLYENDQLNLQMTHGRTFPHYSERIPEFLPTYKFNLNTDEYDSSEKARIPAWCDRILSKGNALRQTHYESAPLRFSDHRPVWGIFQCKINIIEQAKKDAISSELYSRRASVVGDISDDESLLGYESIEPGLPPASSEKRKWWLDNGLPARSTISPPSGARANPARPSNPWSSTEEPEWVDVVKPQRKPITDAGSRSVSPANSTASKSVFSGESTPSKPVFSGESMSSKSVFPEKSTPSKSVLPEKSTPSKSVFHEESTLLKPTLPSRDSQLTPSPSSKPALPDRRDHVGESPKPALPARNGPSEYISASSKLKPHHLNASPGTASPKTNTGSHVKQDMKSTAAAPSPPAPRRSGKGDPQSSKPLLDDHDGANDLDGWVALKPE